MNLRAPALLLVSTLAACPLPAQTRGAWETFSNVENTRHWTVTWFETSETFDPLWNEDPFFPEFSFIYTVFPSQGGGLTISNFRGPDRPLDYLSGDLADNRSVGYSFDLVLENPDGIASLDTSFYSVTTGKYYYSPNLKPDLVLGYQTITRLFFEGEWKVFVPGTGYVDATVPPEALDEVNDFVVRAWAVAPDTGGIIGIDNFKVIPENVVPALETALSGEVFQVNFERLLAQVYSLGRADLSMSPIEFDPVEGSGGVTGEGPYSFSVPMTEPTELFRVETEIENVEIGNIGDPPVGAD